MMWMNLQEKLFNPSGIYAITPTYIFKNELLDAVAETLESEIKLIQYRFENKISFEEKYETAKKIQSMCTMDMYTRFLRII